ncbi:bifunctional 2-polyprenyl-6-hydroxyphenol methylase/3-demethylubiquinol 3-O-methyltransferase UbiG [Catenovulum sp. SM1970]|uniref:bifunctional 2-polyprenyl-6-hydroxyphenol methylase/3-demethylubiquinol 3-O-methyltransferase UbiG n=1 Tax=Marinifaba aquimaris TaxID=2741323 RepID=UPI001572C786|nr:bifunctional 2-polyprenyl-6-hydroxyphenol methylase/3-demethylubiquinol 3-O-methyltransferase UbiG [Marinifaba aquimaris]NTS77940.1 bifunctional 2-polyprenyl-6-hydroxyphenol methylase/3-demethylubiquinol 3-O-methyltransferase UbiG [Marinifaba aquimaris]
MSLTNADNLDQQEVEKFDEIAHNWWDKDQEFAPLHQINPCRLDFILGHAGQLYDKQVLDVGCGGGILSYSMAKHGAKVTGIDAAEQAIKIAQLHAKSQSISIDFQQTLAEPFSENHDSQFDIVTCMEMLEHVPDPESVIQAACKTLKPGGQLFVSTLNKTLKAYLLGVVAAENILGLVPKGTHEHDKFIKPSRLIAMIESQGLKVKQAKGMHYNPLTKSAKLNDDLSINYLLYAYKPTSAEL